MTHTPTPHRDDTPSWFEETADRVAIRSVSRQNQTLGQAMEQAIKNAFLITGVGLVTFLVAATFQVVSVTPFYDTGKPPAEAPLGPVDHAAELFLQHNCWQSNAPRKVQNQTPTHVIVILSRDGQPYRSVYDAKHLEAALEDVLFKDDPDLKVYAFCE